ncbi:hypothetical protein B0H34DRAFT_700715 [Crassisporium funariophilum]|nr:hypothetical protein B0H34DRAFT_700715 [Crassisporium funariophilum]
MALPPQNHLAWKVCITLLHFLAISCTIVRIGHRARTRRMWWDDYVVVVPLAFDFVYIITMWMRLRNHDISWTSPDQEIFISSTWFASFLYFTIIWFCRISLILSLTRIFPPGHHYRIWTFSIAGAFFLIYVASILLNTLTCPGKPTWWQLDFGTCLLDGTRYFTASIVGVVLEFAADIVLVITPLFMLWRIKFSRTKRILVLSLFSGSILTILASVLYLVIWYMASSLGPDSRLIFIMMSHLQVVFSLLVCNLLVVTMLVYCRVQREDSDDENSTSQVETSEKTATRMLRSTDNGDAGTLPPSDQTFVTLTSELYSTDQSIQTRGTYLSSSPNLSHRTSTSQQASQDTPSNSTSGQSGGSGAPSSTSGQSGGS